MVKLNPSEILQEYEKGKAYNSSIDLYKNVDTNERFYTGDHWNGVETPSGMLKPIFNFTKRVVSYFIAMLVTNDVGVNIEPFAENTNSLIESKIISKEIEKNIERTKAKSKFRTIIRNGCVNGDSALHVYFDPTIDTKEAYKGDVECEIADNTNIIFGNPYCSDIQKQPYILVIQRLYADMVKEDAKTKYKVKADDLDKIKSNSDNLLSTDDNLTTVITKYYFKNGSIHYVRICGEVTLIEETQLGYKRYPIAYFSWEKVKNSYHGQSPITGMIPNQIFINKIFAMAMVYITNNGFPKIMFDSSKIKELSNDVTESYGINHLDIIGKVIEGTKVPDFSAQVPQIAEMVISYTRDCLGANDAALGNVKADNTSAIVALQNASAVPLELQKLAYNDFIEEYIRILIEVMGCHYGVRKVKVSKEDYLKLNPDVLNQIEEGLISEESLPDNFVIKFDFSVLKQMNYDLNIDIGSSSYWSESMQITTLDNLVSKGILTDAVIYLEAIPDKYIKNKGKIIESIKEKEAEMKRMQEQQMMQQGAIPTQTM